MLSMVDGSMVVPAKFIIKDSKEVFNLDYLEWKKDQILRSYIHVILTAQVFAQVVNYKSDRAT